VASPGVAGEHRAGALTRVHGQMDTLAQEMRQLARGAGINFSNVLSIVTFVDLVGHSVRRDLLLVSKETYSSVRVVHAPISTADPTSPCATLCGSGKDA
jgi:hypothetical protein